MKIKKLVSVIVLLVTILALSGCKSKNASLVNLNQPDKINMYVGGKQKQLSKNGSKYDQTLFDRINVLVNIRIPQEFSTMKEAISDKDINEFKGYSVEFVYNNAQVVIIDNKRVQFKEVVFPLSERWQNTAFIKTQDNFYTGVELKENLDYLVKASVR